MTVRDLAQRLGAEILVEGELDRPVTAGYAGDLLSWVMGRARSGQAWITIMSNINTVAVASLADTAGIILVEDAVLDADAKARAEQQEIAVYGTSLPAFETALKIASLLG